MLHDGDRAQVEKELALVIEGVREHREISFRIACMDRGYVDVDCIFRSMSMSAGKQVFALLVKAPVSV
jgi:hypothetical protein